MSQKRILIHGIEIKNPSRSNRGAEQLLRSAVERVHSWGARPFVTAGKVSDELRSELDLGQYVGNPRADRLERKLPSIGFASYCTAKALDGVLDVSGFALGDSWGPTTAGWLGRKFKLWNSVGAPVVLLPQAFGPFEAAGMGAAALGTLGRCTLVYARDEQSMTFVVKLEPDVALARCVDITLGAQSHYDVNKANELIIVPNWNLTRETGADEYVQTLVDIASWANDSGMSVIGLLHEGEKDLQLLRAVEDRATIEVVDDSAGWDVKERLGSARLVVSGRYHAMLGSLSMGTPVAVHSWSHKYREALDSFGVSEWQCDPTSAAETIELLQEMISTSYSDQLLERAAVMRKEVDSMWLEVAEVFGL